MGRILFVVLFLTFTVIDSFAAEFNKSRVVSVSSGNLISLQDQTGKIRQMDLYGIDSPENEQQMGPPSHKMLTAMIHDKDVEVKMGEMSEKGVVSAFIFLNGVSINAAMVKSGYAWVNPATCKASDCSTWSAYQQYARKNKKGLWVDPEAEPPWKWRESRAKAEAIAQKVNEENEYASYYEAMSKFGRKSAKAGKAASVSTSIAGREMTPRRSYARKSAPVAQTRQTPSRG